MTTTTAPRADLTSRRPELTYLPALDGLRALAVVAVMLYHGPVSWLPGGFLGVDLFFVLSGYLITTLLLQEWARWGSVDVFAFWARRARRLLPALFLMLLAVAGYAATLGPESQQAAIRSEGLATLFYVSNWWAILNEQSYFLQFVQPSPLAHTWSLAIEEQWYLVFPIILAVVLALRRPGRWLAVVLMLAAVASALWMAFLFAPGTDPSREYFGTDTRVQDLLVGAALAAWLAWRADPRRGPTRSAGRARAPWAAPLAAAAPWVALLAVVAAMLTVTEVEPALYRGGFLLFSLVCAVLIGSCSRADDRALVRALSWEPVRRIGLISYGLYLWHWPVDVAFTPARMGLDGSALLVLRLSVTFALATASFVLVERPVRHGSLERTFGRRGAAYVGLGGAALVAAALVVATPTAASSFGADGSGSGGTTQGQGIQTFFVGDSVSYNLRYYYDATAESGLALNGSARLGCGLIPKTNLVDDKPDPPAEGCAEWAAGWPAEVKAAHPELAVLFLGSWEQFDVLDDGSRIGFGTPEYAAYLDAYLEGALADLDEAAEHVAVVNVPCHRVVEDGVNPIPTIVNDQSRVDWLNAYLADYQRRSAVAFHLVDLDRFVCQDGDPVERDGVQMRFDGLHFTPEGAALVWQWLAPELVAAASS